MNDVLLLLACAAVTCTASVLSYLSITRWHARHHLPAALDNTPGTDPHLLWECRRIDRQPYTRKEN